MLFTPINPSQNPKNAQYKTAIAASACLPIRESKRLLEQSSNRQAWLKAIQNSVSSEIYKDFYQPAIEIFAYYIQDLPAHTPSLFSVPGGLLDQGLSRASQAITLCASINPLETTHVSNQQALWRYALFTAALLLDINQLIKYSIALYNQSFHYIKQWNPLMGSMTLKTNAYYYAIQNTRDQILPRLTNSCLAILLLEKNVQTRKGFQWIASSPVTLETWLSLLIGEESRLPVPKIMTLLPFADSQAVKQQLEAIKALAKKNTRLFSAKTEANSLSDWALGERFLQWIRNKISAGQLAVNTPDASIQRVDSGVLIDHKLLKQFSDSHKLAIQSVEKQFHTLIDLYDSHWSNQPFNQLGGIAQALQNQWLSVRNPALVFGIDKVPAPHTLHGFGKLLAKTGLSP
jgi:Putative helicase/Putative conjugal transfer nickase/helicase TraI C-term